ncbi:flavodoxin family protein [Mesorhizobium sp. NBSH29]|uniref:NAD(P)H-dependent oxidoreductase n=1 Tax=Mesorhizobium sp. NBSH29 TaxID=2654249 RepID=UPI0018965FD9|nr:NAD(P)H-dependent oxidoreductase [Mesorhizobium sp. NBSH29]QPC88128.1 flavodoxin family protein [Mesorhizobium sp. NBSH29]
MRVLVVFCHPVPESFCAALREGAMAALSQAGHAVEQIDLYADNFNPVLGVEERRHYNEGPPADPALKPYAEILGRAEALVFIYPTWWYGLPAMLKGFFDRVWAADVAFRLPTDGGRIISLIGHIRKIAVITTCGAPWWFSFIVGQPGRKTILRGMRALCAPRCQTRYLAHYNMDRSTPESRESYLAKVKTTMRRF